MSTREIIAAMQISLDGLIEGPEGEIDWVGSWDDSYGLLDEVDTCVLGGGMYPGYEEYWLGILADPHATSPLTGMVPTEAEVAYARFADHTRHLVISRTLDEVEWETARIVRDVEEIARLKEQPGKGIYAVGGATLISSLITLGLVDELRLTVHPIVLGAGKPLFKDVNERHGLELVDSAPQDGGRVSLTYRPIRK